MNTVHGNDAEVWATEGPMQMRAPQSRQRMAHLGGLDGLRALALAVVVVFHFWPSVLPGGFLGVTMFFALSGYLITATVLHERGNTGRVSIKAFYVRRVRRLLPASLLTIAAVVATWALAGWFTREVSDNSTAAVLQVANWQRLYSHQPYGLSADSMPLLHFWSLAIEEQVYWIFPLIAAWGVTRRRFAVPLALIVALSATTSWMWRGDSVTVYYSTLTRAGELAVGALAALALHGRVAPRRLTRLVGVPAVLGTVAFLALCRLTSLTTSQYYEGGLLLVGVGCALIVGTLALSPATGRVFDQRVLVWVGKRSYGMYLLHWPLILALRRAGVPGAEWWAVAGTVALSALSYAYVEAPIRTRRAVVRRPRIVAFGGIAAVLVAAIVVPVAPTTAGGIDFSAAQRAAEELAATSTVPTTSAAPPTGADAGAGVNAGAPAAEPPVTYALFGDSKVLMLGLSAFNYVSADLQAFPGQGEIGCPLGRGGRIRDDASNGRGWPPDPACDWSAPGSHHVAPGGLDVAVVYFGSWDIAEREVPTLDDRWHTIADARYRDWLHSEMLTYLDALHTAGARHVVWLTLAPSMGPPARVEMYNAMLATLAAERPGVADVIDLGGWFSRQPDLQHLLPDGVHTSWTRTDIGTGVEVVERFLAAEIVRIGRTSGACSAATHRRARRATLTPRA